MLSELSAIEAAWLLISLAGLFFSGRSAHTARLNRDAAAAAGNGGAEARRLVARGVLFRNRARVAIFSWWTLLGIVFGFFAVPQPLGFAGLLGLMGTAGIYAITAASEDIEGRTLDELLKRQEAEKRRLAEEHDRVIATALRETADNTARIADNTEPTNG